MERESVIDRLAEFGLGLSLTFLALLALLLVLHGSWVTWIVVAVAAVVIVRFLVSGMRWIGVGALVGFAACLTVFGFVSAALGSV